MIAQNNSLPIPENRLGVYAVGTSFYKGGREIRGIGVCHWHSFINEVQPLGVAAEYVADLTDIKNNYGIPYVRVSLGFYSGASWYTGWYTNQANYFAKLDAYVAKCERLGLGLIPTMAWGLRDFADAAYPILGMVQPVKNLAYKHTPLWQLFEQHVRSIVARYKDSPAIWGWELCNEGFNQAGCEYFQSWKLDGTGVDGGGTTIPVNWGPRQDGSPNSPADKMSYQEYHQFSTNFIALVNSIDPHRRIISSGNAVGNSFAVNAQTSNQLTADTLAQWNGNANTENIPWIAYRDKAYPIICMHIYPQSLSNSRFFNGAEKTMVELIALSKGWSDSVGKPFLLGEWGATYHGDPVDETSTNLATEQANFNAALTYVQANIKLSAVWNYGGDLAGASPWMKWKLKDPSRTYQLTAIAAANAAMNP